MLYALLFRAGTIIADLFGDPLFKNRNDIFGVIYYA